MNGEQLNAEILQTLIEFRKKSMQVSSVEDAIEVFRTHVKRRVTREVRRKEQEFVSKLFEGLS